MFLFFNSYFICFLTSIFSLVLVICLSSYLRFPLIPFSWIFSSSFNFFLIFLFFNSFSTSFSSLYFKSYKNSYEFINLLTSILPEDSSNLGSLHLCFFTSNTSLSSFYLILQLLSKGDYLWLRNSLGFVDNYFLLSLEVFYVF